MEQQQFGSIETPEGNAQAMLCIDADRPNEYMIHWFGQDITAGATLCTATEHGTAIHLKPSLLFRQAQGGNLYAPPFDQLTPDEKRGLEEVTGNLLREGTKLVGAWRGIDGRSRKLSFEPPIPTGVTAHTCTSWSDFKEWASDVRNRYDAISFRGHGSNQFRLQTTLSRAGRSRVDRYCAFELIEFKSHAEAVLRMRIDMSKGDDYSMLLGLAQHHGLPTPLLDWTASPYIAAFFAFADALESKPHRPDPTHVRVLALTRAFINATSPPVVTLPAMWPYVASLAIAPIHNPRLYAQQGRFLVTNVTDVETFIRAGEQKIGEKHLFAADVPISSAPEAIEDLQFMGVTAANMFPGLDGICRMIRHNMSTRRPPTPIPGKPSAPEVTPEDTQSKVEASQSTDDLLSELRKLFSPKPNK